MALREVLLTDDQWERIRKRVTNHTSGGSAGPRAPRFGV